MHFQVELIEKMRICLNIDKWIPLGHSFGGMLALLYAHIYPKSTAAVIYDCPMWSARYTARAIALATEPYFAQKHLTEKLEAIQEILKDETSPKDAFMQAASLEWDEGLSRFCHVIETERYNAYINEHLEDPHVPDECWGRFVTFRQKIFDSADFYGDYLGYLSEIEKPQLLIVGEYDMTCGRYEQEWFREHATNGRMTILSQSAHLSWVEQPEEYTRLVTEFVLGV